MGALALQRALSDGLQAAGAVLLAPLAPGGLLLSAGHLAWTDPKLLGQTLLYQVLGPEWADVAYAERALFSTAPDAETLERYTRLIQPESTRALAEMSAPLWVDAWRVRRTPLLVLGAEHDAVIPAWMVTQVARLYGLSPVWVPGVGHAMMLDAHWERGAEALETWLRVRFEGSPSGAAERCGLPAEAIE